MNKITLTKREKIVITSIILPSVLLLIWFLPIAIFLNYKFTLLAGLVILTYFLSLWSLWEGINKLKGFILMILPTLLTVAVANYFFLLPSRLLAVPVSFIFGMIVYTLLLSQNVFNVASIRTIPLYRAASTTVFVLTMITAFCLFNVIAAFNLMFIWFGLAVFALSFLLILPVLWSIEMERVNSLILVTSAVLSLVMGEIAVALSFWPLYHPIGSLVLMTALFIVLGLGTDALKDRLSRGEVWEYIGWGVAVFLIALFTTSWTG